MTADQFRAALAERGLTQSSFARRVEVIGGEKLPLRTVQSWALDESRIPPVVPALLALWPATPASKSYFLRHQ